MPKKKETHHEESHHEDWSSWSSYDSHDGKGKGHEHKSHGTKNVKNSGVGHPAHLTFGGGHGQGYETHGQLYDPRVRPHGMPVFPVDGHQDMHSDFIGGGGHPVPPMEGGSNAQIQNFGGQYEDAGLAGYSYPPQYDVKEVSEVIQNDIEPYNEAFEEGYRKGHQSVTGHVLSEDLRNFYDNKFEEGDSADNAYNNDSYENFKNFESLKDGHGNDEHADDEYNRRRGRRYLLPYRNARFNH